MNYKSKLLSVFLSAGILLNSTSMAFAGQDDVGTVLDNQCVKNEDPYERFLNYPKELANEGEKVFYVDGKEWRQGVEWSEEQKGDEWSPNIFWLYNERTKTLYILGKNGCALADRYNHEYNWWRYINKDEVEHLVIIGLKRIGSGAFCRCTELKTLELSEGINYIGDSAFSGCKKLTTVNMPKSLKWIGTWAFADCDLTSIELPEGFMLVWECAFVNNKHLKTVKMMGCVREEDHPDFNSCFDIAFGRVFDGCEALASITLPKRLKSKIYYILGDAKDNEGLKIEYTE